MFVRGWALGALLLGATACSMDVDVSGLEFAPDDAASGADARDYGPISCARYVHCLLGKDDAPADVDACLASVSAACKEDAEELETCRQEQCGVLPDTGDDQAASAMVECLFRECTAATVKCVSGRGESTCLSYAVKWQSQAAGTTQCTQVPEELCLLDYLATVQASDRISVTSLIQCIVELPEGALEQLSACLSLCQ